MKLCLIYPKNVSIFNGSVSALRDQIGKLSGLVTIRMDAPKRLAAKV
jgi:hypothetical protein